MPAPRIAINGFGRIGRTVIRIAKMRGHFNVVAVNDLASADALAYNFKYDSVHRTYPGEVSVDGDTLTIDGDPFKVLSEKDPAKLPWKELAIDYVIESTVVLGVNDHVVTPQAKIVSNASCTTNCAAPVAKVLHEAFGIKRGLLNTIHAYTADQRLVDTPHKDFRRSRHAALNIIPTSTGAAKAIGHVYPKLAGKLDGLALRVPVPDGSVIDLTVELARNVTTEQVNAAMKQAADGPMKGIIEYCTDPVVSSDMIGNPHSSIFDAELTQVIDGNFLKIIAWYDNEWGYSTRVEDLIVKMAQQDGLSAAFGG